MTDRINFLKLLTLFLLILLVRIIYLEADSSIFLDSGQVGDEGYWLYNARNLAIFGKLAEDDFYHDLVAAPLFTLFSYISFSAVGVGFWQARLVSALSGFYCVTAAFLIAKEINHKAAFFTALILGFNSLLLFQNRLAVPESQSIFFVTLSVLLWIRKSPFLSGLSVTLALFAKTTAFLFLPSYLLIALYDLLSKRISLRDFLKSFAGLGISSFVIWSFIHTKWDRQITLIYSTFGKWYSPEDFLEIVRNFVNFFIHPFWGSPFLFSTVIIVLVNIVFTIFSKRKLQYVEKILYLWLAGALILSPFMSKITNARLLPLLVPLSILTANTIIHIENYYLNLSRVKLKIGKIRKTLFLGLASFLPALISSKVLLAAFKRISGNENAILYFLETSIILCIILWIYLNFLTKQKFFDLFLKINIVLLLSLPLVPLFTLIGGYLSAFGLAHLSTTIVLGVIAFAVLPHTFLLFYRKTIFKNYVKFLIVFQILLTVFGTTSIFYKPTFRLISASRDLRSRVDNKSVVGFYGHELAIENSSKPIYWAPHLAYVGEVNRDWERYKPSILYVTRIFDGQKIVRGSWPEESDVVKNLVFLETLDLSRTFLTYTRTVSVDVFKIEN